MVARRGEIEHQGFVQIILHVADRDRRSFGDRFGEREGFRLQPVVGDHAVHQADRLAPGRIDPVAGEHQFPCPRRADQPCQEPGDAVIAAQAHLEIAGGKECRFRGDPHVAGHRQSESGADRGAGQGGNGRLAHRDQRAGQQTLPLLQVGDPLVMGHCELCLVAIGAHALDVAAGTEGCTRAGEQQRADIRILAAGLDHCAQGRRQIIRHRIARLGAVQRDDGDAVADHAEQFVGAGVDFDFGGHVSPHVFVVCHCVGTVGWAKRACPPFNVTLGDRWWARRALLRPPYALRSCQNFSTHGRNSTSQVQALRGCCSTFQ